MLVVGIIPTEKQTGSVHHPVHRPVVAVSGSIVATPRREPSTPHGAARDHTVRLHHSPFVLAPRTHISAAEVSSVGLAAYGERLRLLRHLAGDSHGGPLSPPPFDAGC